MEEQLISCNTHEGTSEYVFRCSRSKIKLLAHFSSQFSVMVDSSEDKKDEDIRDDKSSVIFEAFS